MTHIDVGEIVDVNIDYINIATNIDIDISIRIFVCVYIYICIYIYASMYKVLLDGLTCL